MNIQLQSSRNFISACRICLQENGKYHIFENLYIHSKLLLCMREKIENIDGFPNKICEVCKDTLDKVCNFINKYKETSKTLTNSIFSIKQEIDGEQIEISAVKLESDDLYSDHEYADIFKPLDVQVNELNCNGNQPKRKKVLNRKNLKSKRPPAKKKEFSIKKRKPNSKTNKLNVKDTPKKNKETEEICKENDKDILLSENDKVKKPHDDPTKLCDQCGKTFESASLLSYHRAKSHKTDRKIKCTVCLKLYSNSYYLDRHMKRMHGGEKNIPCPQCNKMFGCKSDMSAHKNSVHMKHVLPKKLWTCKFCNKQYKSPQAKVVHERTVHTGERPEICKVCDESFASKCILNEHMRLHTGATPYKCPICGRGYAQCGNMKSHLRNHKISDLDEATLKKMRPSHLKYMRP